MYKEHREREPTQCHLFHTLYTFLYVFNSYCVMREPVALVRGLWSVLAHSGIVGLGIVFLGFLIMCLV